MKRQPDASYCLLGADTIARHLNAMARQARGVRLAEDIEHIHHMRVASRRLNTALSLFGDCLPQRQLAHWRKVTRRLRRALGAARDTDVQIELVRFFLKETPTPSHRAGVQRLLLRLRQHRSLLQQKVEKALQRLQTSTLVVQLRQTCADIRTRAHLRHIREASPWVYNQAHKSISSQLRELLAFEPYVDQPQRIHELHQMRIAAKHLRYTMEVFAHLYEDELEGPLKTARDTQTLLGAVHDADVWLGYLPLFLEEERRRTIDHFGDDKAFVGIKLGVHDFLRSRRKARATSYSEFRNFWRDAKKRMVWESLTATLRRTCRTARNESLGKNQDKKR